MASLRRVKKFLDHYKSIKKKRLMKTIKAEQTQELK